MRRLIYLLPIAAFMALAGYFVVSLSRDPSVLPSAMINQPAPAFTLAGLQGQPGLARDEFRGQVVLINFFASWCVPCRAEHPLLMQLAAELKAPVYGIDYKDKPEDAARFLSELGDPYGRIGADRDGRVGIDFGVYGVPETYVIDRNGVIRYKRIGPVTVPILQEKILPLVRQLQG